MYDSAMHFVNLVDQEKVLKDLGIDDDFVLSTIHRAENTDSSIKLKSIVEQLNAVHREMQLVLPLHPRTKAAIEREGLELEVKIIEPQGYLEMLALLKNAKLVITDSGGLQKEAYFFKKYCLTVRDQTEWLELIDHGVNELVDPLDNGLIEAFKRASGEQKDFPEALYGRADAAELIISEIIKELS